MSGSRPLAWKATRHAPVVAVYQWMLGPYTPVQAMWEGFDTVQDQYPPTGPLILYIYL